MHNYFFDYTSTSPVDEEVLNAYDKALKTYYHNSEAMYDEGIKVKKLLNTSRNKIAELLKVKSDEVIFTSGASEANNLALKGYALANKHRGKHIITTCYEHSSVSNSCKQLAEEFDFDITYLPIDQDGKVNISELKAAIRPDTILVSIMFVNNELGSINPIAEIGELLKDKPIAFMVDGVQGVGKIPFDLNNIDLFTMSLHKLRGLKGSGILICKDNIKLLPLISGGQQEFGIRGGTSNAPTNIVAFKTLNKALENMDQHQKYISELRDYLVDKLTKNDNIAINTPLKNSVPNIINFSIKGLNSEIVLNALNKHHIQVSAQSSCVSRTKEPSKSVLALTHDEKRASNCIRISLSEDHQKSDIDYLVKVLEEIINEYQVNI